jgi:two-component system nitrogen regulation response regulator GlnG
VVAAPAVTDASAGIVSAPSHIATPNAERMDDMGLIGMPGVPVSQGWEQSLECDAQKLLASGQPDVWDALTRRFESRLIRTALTATHGRRMEAAQRLGIGRNTITRKIQELGLDAPDEG